MRNHSRLLLLSACLLLGACSLPQRAPETESSDAAPPSPAPDADAAMESAAAEPAAAAVTASKRTRAEIATDAVAGPAAGTLTAGDYDDLLNPSLYARYAGNYLQSHSGPGLPFVDTRQSVRVRVTDRNGKPVPFAEVAAGSARLPTAADGSAVLFPALDKLDDKLEISVRADGRSASRTIAIASLPADRSINVELPVAAPAVGAFDLLLVLDTTGSMGDELNYLQTELDAIVDGLRRAHPNLDIRLGLIAYRDEGDEYVTRPFPFTGKIDELRAALAEQSAEGGGDYPEAVHTALAEATRFDWRERAVKALLFVADAPPHEHRMKATWASTETLRRRGVHIVPVAASGVADEAQYLMRSMAAATQSRYLFLTDDSGVGQPHQDPDVPCYVVTSLDGLVQRVLDGLISGHRIEPTPQQVLRRVGDYDRGVCLPAPRQRDADAVQSQPE